MSHSFKKYVILREGVFAHQWANTPVNIENYHQLGVMADHLEESNPDQDDIKSFLSKVGDVVREFYQHMRSQELGIHDLGEGDPYDPNFLQRVGDLGIGVAIR